MQTAIIFGEIELSVAFSDSAFVLVHANKSQQNLPSNLLPQEVNFLVDTQFFIIFFQPLEDTLFIHIKI